MGTRRKGLCANSNGGDRERIHRHIPDYVESKETILLSFKGKRDDLNGIALIDKKDGNARVLENIKFDDNFRWLPKQFFSLDEAGAPC